MRLLMYLAIFLLSIQLNYCQEAQQEPEGLPDGEEGSEIDIESQNLFEGDVIMPPSRTRNGILKTKRWPKGVVPYVITDNYTDAQVSRILHAMKAIEKYTCITFIPRTNETGYIDIVNGSGCSSAGIGYQGRRHVVSLHTSRKGSCFAHHIIIHELLHAICLWHEQSRHDRDDYITLHQANMQNGSAYQFRLVTDKVSSTYNISYNYLSVMHYGSKFFSANRNVTMEPKDSRYLSIIGHVTDAHEMDYEKVRLIYECNGTYPVAPDNVPPRFKKLLA